MCPNLVKLRFKQRLHKQRQRANVNAKLESYEDLEARMELTEPLGKGPFAGAPDRAITSSECEAIAQDSAKKAADARELLRLKNKEEGELRANAKSLAALATPLHIMAQSAPSSPMDDASVALGEEMEEAPPAVPAGECLDIRKPPTPANDREILKRASFNATPDINVLCQRMANEAHKSVLPDDSHATAMGAIKGECGLRASATTAPGLLKVAYAAVACRKMRIQRRLLGLGTSQGQKPKPKPLR